MNKSRRIITTISIILMILWTIYYYGFDYLKEYILLINEEIIEKEIIIDNTISEEEENEYEEVEINDENDEEEINELDHLSHIKYARNFLSLSGQKVYDALVKNSLVHNVSYFNITPISEKELIKVFTVFLNDNPDIFWVNNIKYYINANTKKVIKIEMLYSISKAERNLRQVQIDNVVNNIMEKVNEYHNDYDKIKYIHDYIIDNTTYDLNATDNQNIYSVFVNKKSVCTGYARSFQYLMNKLGIYSLYITGKIINSNEEGIGHAWNIVKIGNHYYHIDVTWGSSIFNTDQEEKEKYINYHYFNITTDELLKTHIIDMDYQLPLAKGITYNYYYKEKLLFNKYNYTVIERLKEEMINKNNIKEKVYSIKFTSSSEYKKALNGLFKQKDLFMVIKGANRQVKNKINDRRVKYYASDDKFIIDMIIYYK